ncbi:solute carrier family 2 member 11, like [Periophthalmus magnuspinnatus]|uniref:solute carrier family 2 member 11, like n=1 Tax=Periophthalmus magnuspinnatus TaxID=409849 RepID=UPI0024366A6C|nr:solute carrier family 2 member 11, like [Periophthalmus magnuspinnatus]
MSQNDPLLLECPLVIAAIFICGIGGPYQYGFSISSMTSPSVFIQELVNITCVERYGVNLEKWQISLIWSFIVSIFCMGGLSLSALLANSLISKFGRKKLLLLNNIPALIGAVLMLLSKTAMSFEMIMAARFLQGMNAGLGLITNTIYLVECAPKRLRGAVGVTVALFISFGKFSGQLLGISELFGTRERWPWLLGFTGLTSLLQLVTLPLLPESPSFLLLAAGDQQACEQALKRLWGDRNYQLEMEEMLKEKVMQKNAGTQTVLQLLRNHDIRWQLLSVIVIFSSLQLCGINAVYFYSYEVFRQVGIGEENLRYAALGTGLCELSASSSLFFIVQYSSKKMILFRGYALMSVMLVLLTITMYLQKHLSWMPYCSMVLIFLFILSFASGPCKSLI